MRIASRGSEDFMQDLFNTFIKSIGTKFSFHIVLKKENL